MPLDPSTRPTRSGSGQDLWPKWMWVAVPVLVVFVVAGLWWAIFSDSGKPAPKAKPSPTIALVKNQPTQGPTVQKTLSAADQPTARPTLSEVATFTPTAVSVITPTAQATAVAANGGGLAVGSKVKVVGTGGSGLNMRAGAGTGHARVKTLQDGSAVEVIGGPKDANGFTWWQIRDESGTTGWAASKFLGQ